MSKSNQQYWAEREEEAIKNRIENDKEMAKELETMYQVALKDIQKDIAEFYMKYATKNGITMQDAQKLASKMDVKEFAKYAKEYVKNKDFSDKANEELALYNLKMKVSRLELLEEQINMHLCGLYNDTTEYMYEQFNQAAIDQAKEQAGILGEVTYLSQKAMEEAVNGSYKSGTFSDNIWADKEKLRKNLMKSVNQSIVLGKHPYALAGQFAKEMNASLSNAKRILRTEVGCVHIAQQRAGYIENGVKYYQVICEPSACCTCREKASDSRSIDDAPKYEVSNMEPGINAPLFHPNCRCSTIPVVDDGIRKENFSEYEEALKLPTNTYQEIKEKPYKVMEALGLSPDEANAVMNYIGFDYEFINRQLRTDKNYKNSDEVKLLSKALEKIPIYEGKVYRYSNIDSKILMDAVEHGFFHDKGFLSTTKNDAILDVVGKPNVKFVIKQSKHGRDLKGINDDESEVLFNTGTRFAILNLYIKDDILVVEMIEEG